MSCKSAKQLREEYQKTAKLLNEAADDLKALKLPRGAKFEMNTFGEHKPTHKPGLTVDNACGTAACAAGWLSLMPKWRRRGFTSYWKKEEDDEFSYRDKWYLEPSKPKSRISWEKMADRVFGTRGREMWDIFMMTTSRRREVIKAFRELAQYYEEMAENWSNTEIPDYRYPNRRKRQLKPLTINKYW